MFTRAADDYTGAICPKCDSALITESNLISCSSDKCDYSFQLPLASQLLEVDRRNRIYSYTKWDAYFYQIACTVAIRSKCLSRRLGVVIVDPKSDAILSTGYNGPARGVPACGPDRMNKDKVIKHRLEGTIEPVFGEVGDCPRVRLGYDQAEHIDLCPAVHAERNAIYNAARRGTPLEGAVLYTTDQVPCSKCLSALIQVGIEGVVVSNLEHYDWMTDYILGSSELKIRKYHLSDQILLDIWKTIATMKGA